MAVDKILYAHFVASGTGATGLTVTIDVWRVTKSNSATSHTVTAGSATELADGWYFYKLSGIDLRTYDYTATFKTAGTADQKHLPAMWSLYDSASEVALPDSALAFPTNFSSMVINADGSAKAEPPGVTRAAVDSVTNPSQIVIASIPFGSTAVTGWTCFNINEGYTAHVVSSISVGGGNTTVNFDEATDIEAGDVLMFFPGRSVAMTSSRTAAANLTKVDGTANASADVTFKSLNLNNSNGDAFTCAAVNGAAMNLVGDSGSGFVDLWLSGSGTIKSSSTTVNVTRINNADVATSTRLATAGYTTPPTVGAIADQVWDEALAGHATAGSAGAALGNVSAGADPATIADAVWDEVLSGHLTSGTTGEALDAARDGATSISTGGNTFRTPHINGTLTIPQGMTWADTSIDAIAINQDGGNWPDLSAYTGLTGTNGIFLNLKIRPGYTNLANYTSGSAAATLSVRATATGTDPSQVVSIRPGTPTANLMPTSTQPGLGLPYEAQVWAINGTNRITLFKGLADVTDDVTAVP